MTSSHIHVVGAVIVRDGEVLCARRGPGGAMAGLWEFPGGKIEPGETPREALAREIVEELACEVAVGALVEETTHAGDIGLITLTTFWCELRGEAMPMLTEHAELRWLRPAALRELEWAPADVPAVARIQAAFAASPD